MLTYCKYLLCAYLWCSFPLWGSNVAAVLEEAYQNYQQAENTSSYTERNQMFNRALSLYHQAQAELKISDAALNQALGDTYFQLNEYAWAILYYQRALKTTQSEILLDHLAKAQKMLGLSQDDLNTQPAMLPKNRFLSYYQMVGVFFLAFLMCSIAIWWQNKMTYLLAIISLISLLLLMGGYGLNYYSTPIEGILIRSTGFYRSANWNQTQLTELPLLAGTKVQILQISDKKDWLKIKNASGIVGYIPTDRLRLISCENES